SNGTAPGTVTVLLGNGSAGVGDGTFGITQTYAVGSLPAGLLVGEFSEDGHADLVIANSGSGTISVLPGLATGIVSNVISVIAPAGGETALVGTPMPLSWTRGDGVRSVN